MWQKTPKNLYVRLNAGSEGCGTLIIHHVRHAVSQQSLSLSQASIASQSRAASTDQSAEVPD